MTGPMPNCPSLDAYLDGELSPEERRLVTRHLEVCADCRETLRANRAVRDAFHSHRQVTAPPKVMQGALERIHAASPRAADRPPLRSSSAHRQARPRWVMVAAAACAALALVVGLWLTRPASSPVDAPPLASAEEVAQARAELKYTLGLVGHAQSRAGRVVRDDVLGGVVDASLDRARSPAR